MRDDDLDEGTDICIAGRSPQNAVFYAVYLFFVGMNSILLNVIVCFLRGYMLKLYKSILGSNHRN